MVVLVLSILLAAFYLQSVNENRYTLNYEDSVRAFWLAEAGIAQIKGGVGISAVSGYIDSTNRTYSAVPTLISGTTNYYNVVSTGRVTSPDGRVTTRSISAVMKLTIPSATRFQYGVETTSVDLDYKAKNIVNPENPANIAKTGSTQTFQNLFEISKAQMKAISQSQGTYLSGSFGNTIDANGVTWVDVNPGQTLNIQHLNGSGIVVINGNFKLVGVPGGGGSTFNGILYVIGQLDMLGNANVYGTVFVESTASIEDDLSGSSLVSYSSANISSALLSVATKTVSSWREI
jgi:Tfp pilus assembly protein PilX